MSCPHDPSREGGRAPQAGAVPFRVRDGRVELCLITSRHTGQWGFPKGDVDPGESSDATARRETWEEAGVRGDLLDEVCGYTYARGAGPRHVVRMYLLRVLEVVDDWGERAQRQRAWVSPEEARRRLDRRELEPVLEDALAKLESRGSDDG